VIREVGIVGGGQLGRMLTEAAHPLGFQVTVLEKTPNSPATYAGARQLVGDLNDPDKLKELAAQSDVLTWEIEHINAEALEDLAYSGYNIQPSPSTLSAIKDKYQQKKDLEAAGLPVVESVAFDTFSDDSSPEERIKHTILKLGGNIIFKTRTGGYDGRGNFRYQGDVAALEASLGSDWDNLYAEKIIPFDKELSILAARDLHGNTVIYHATETVQKNNICHTTITPASIEPRMALQAKEIGHETMLLLKGAGVFAIEMFATDNQVIINEIAPRVHNSGHYTIEGAVTSQFEQHIRAITGLPLGSTALRAPAVAMINILGTRDEPLNREGLDKLMAYPDTHPHFYGKDSRPARKLGHITVLAATRQSALDRATAARNLLTV
jgi:5-(carboxyamino)imidazole ribonucleotide synthase